MKRLIGVLAVLALAAVAAPHAVRADDAVPGVRGEIIGSMMDAGVKIEELAAAMPDKKYSWRPGKGVRSVSEVYMHVVQANYAIPAFMGAKPPMSMQEIGALDKTPADKAKVAQMLTDSYAFAKQAIAGTPDTDLDAEVTLFGNYKMSKRAAMFLVAAHSHEHLGQSIAYARMNNITPPWTAREMAEAAKKKAEAKK